MSATGEWSGRALGKRGAPATDVPGDELAQHGRPVPLASNAPELIPQVVFDPDRSVRRVGFLHVLHRNPCISKVAVMTVAVYIHGYYDRGYTHDPQVPR